QQLGRAPPSPSTRLSRQDVPGSGVVPTEAQKSLRVAAPVYRRGEGGACERRRGTVQTRRCASECRPLLNALAKFRKVSEILKDSLRAPGRLSATFNLWSTRPVQYRERSDRL